MSDRRHAGPFSGFYYSLWAGGSYRHASTFWHDVRHFSRAELAYVNCTLHHLHICSNAYKFDLLLCGQDHTATIQCQRKHITTTEAGGEDSTFIDTMTHARSRLDLIPVEMVDSKDLACQERDWWNTYKRWPSTTEPLQYQPQR